jgi:hypothetical protein
MDQHDVIGLEATENCTRSRKRHNAAVGEAYLYGTLSVFPFGLPDHDGRIPMNVGERQPRPFEGPLPRGLWAWTLGIKAIDLRGEVGLRPTEVYPSLSLLISRQAFLQYAFGSPLQPNTLVRDEDITLPPINRSRREEGNWSPKNYDGRSFGLITLRQALEDSRNQATASLLRGIDSKPELSLDRICELALELQIYKDCVRFYPFILGAQPLRPIDLAAFYATIANEGARPVPHAIDAVEQDGKLVYRHQPSTVPTASADPASFYQLKAMLHSAGPHVRSVILLHTLPARPARPMTKTMRGLRVSPTMSPWPSG